MPEILRGYEMHERLIHPGHRMDSSMRQCFGLDTHIVINQTKKKKNVPEDATAEASRRIRDKIISKKDESSGMKLLQGGTVHRG